MNLDAEHLLPPQRCPHCGYPTNRASGGMASPAPGDVMICFRCGEANQVAGGSLLVKLDWERLSPQEVAEVRAIQQKLVTFHGHQSG